MNILKAIDFAARAHLGQTQDDGKIPYLVHPVSVGLILSQVNASEDTIIAGILHDTIEDTAVTYKDIEKEFGKFVADTVNHVTEQDTSRPWHERKQAALEHISEMTREVQLVKSADVIHNMTAHTEDYKRLGEKMFKTPQRKRDYLLRYSKLVIALEEKWPENPLIPDLKDTLLKLQKTWHGWIFTT